MLLLTAQCTPTRLQGIIGSKYVKKFCNGAESYQSMNIGGHTVTVNAHSIELYDMIERANNAATGKLKPNAVKVAKLEAGIPHNCLVSDEWLSQHEHDEYPEPTIDL
jgi:hypothetical protein